MSNIINKSSQIMFFLSLAGLSILQIHNIQTYPPEKGFDADGHIQYIHTLQSNHSVPMPHEGWQFYHPPLYHSIAAFFPTIKSAQWLGLFAWIIIVLSSYVLLKKLKFQTYILYVLILLTASLPAILAISPSISNELFSSALISLTLCFYFGIMDNKKNVHYIILGLLFGISLLTKYTALIPTFIILVDLLFRKESKNKFVILTLVITILISGWFYIRNYAYYKNPIIMNASFPQMQINLPLEKRTIDFYLNFVPFLKMDLLYAHYHSFIPGTYFSWFYDGHHTLLPVQEFSKVGIFIIILSLPVSLLFIYGLIKEFPYRNSVSRMLFLYIFLIGVNYFVLTLKYPYYSMVKGYYLISAVIPWAYFIGKGLSSITHKNNIFRIGVFLFAVIWTLIIIKTFWTYAWWYANM